MKVINLSRSEAKHWTENTENSIWITIGEPYDKFQHVSNPAFDSIPTLKMAFWDTTFVAAGMNLGEYFYPPSSDEAKQIVDFILANPGKDVIVNCAAGVSRSGAIAQFCEKLGFNWGYGKHRAVPNHVLYNAMWGYYNEPGKACYGY